MTSVPITHSWHIHRHIKLIIDSFVRRYAPAKQRISCVRLLMMFPSRKLFHSICVGNMYVE